MRPQPRMSRASPVNTREKSSRRYDTQPWNNTVVVVVVVVVVVIVRKKKMK